MAIDISAYLEANFPVTVAELKDEDDIDYTVLKSIAINRAKSDAYGQQTVPTEANIPDKVGMWIADKATLYLIPTAKDLYAKKRHRSRTNQAGDTVSEYDLLRMLDGLEQELEEACIAAWAVVEALIGKATAPSDVPTVSTTGTMIDPVTRALNRGLPL